MGCSVSTDAGVVEAHLPQQFSGNPTKAHNYADSPRECESQATAATAKKGKKSSSKKKAGKNSTKATKNTLVVVAPAEVPSQTQQPAGGGDPMSDAGCVVEENVIGNREWECE
eukprot:GHVN01077424.1.p2 GENE.GHVN01077424.1~~GHVN01077424.1.p2  ORF type:complete len:113 (+),score=24.55 GHVN01077424.1:1412-1750(+)